MRLAPARSSALVSVVALTALLAVGASGPLAARAETITVGPRACGTQRTLHRGDLLVVRLPANASTGYGWKLRSGARTVLALVGRAYVPPKDTTRVGAPGTAVLRFRAAAAGKTVLRLGYARSWEKGVPPAVAFTLRVTVV